MNPPATRSRRFPASVLALLLVLAVSSPPARAAVDFSRATMGRTTYPAGSWVLDTSQHFTMDRTRDPSRDTVQSEVELEHGQTERFSWSVGLQTLESRRDQVQLGRGIAGFRYLAVTAPLQIAPVAEYRPSLRRRADEWDLGFEALKNFERFSLIVQGMVESGKEPGAGRRHTGSLLAGPLYRFGLNGIAGLQWLYESDCRHYLAAEVGGAVSKNIFLGVAPRFGLSERSAAFQLGIKLHIYFGDF
ncbi:MAG: hypothetical protein WC943_17650, partial [Elusimicrobiota bacterium]